MRGAYEALSSDPGLLIGSCLLLLAGLVLLFAATLLAAWYLLEAVVFRLELTRDVAELLRARREDGRRRRNP